MKKSYKLVASILALSLCASALLSGCSSSSSSSASSESGDTTSKSGEATKLTVYSFATDTPLIDELKSLVDDYNKQDTGVTVDLNFPGTDYENVMKVKMASNTLPDIFDTHGWSKARYGDYLADLKDCSWASKLSDTIKPVITDDNGKVYVLPLSEAKDGMVYNADILKQYNIDVPQTFDEFEDACVKIKEQSNGDCTPLFLSGVDSWTIGQFIDVFSTPLLISGEKNYKDDLLNNTFDWSNWTELPEKLLEFHQKGLINEDVLTVKESDLASRLATGKCAFAVWLLGIANDVKSVNADTNIGVMPAPTFQEGDTPAFSGGERNTMGIWKDTKNMDAAKAFLDFVASDDNMEALSDATKEPTAITSAKSSQEYQSYFEKYKDTRVFPYFDRTYIQNGMWDVMCKSGTQLLAEQITPEEFSETMKSENDRLANK